MKSDQFERLTRAVREDAAIRRVRRLQPVGGPGDKIFPPTYPGVRNNDPPRHVFERRRIGGQNVLCVLIDSVQSQANRLEEALKAGRDAGELSFPVIAVDFSRTDVKDIGRITTLDAPHRIFDAIIRDSEIGGKRFFKDTEDGRRLMEAKAAHARAVFDLSPAALVFGAWNSTGEGGGLGAKFPRAIVSEIIGVGVAVENGLRTGETEKPSGQRTGSRVDPLGIRSGVRVYKTPDGDWSLEPPRKSREAREVRPSEVNHSNIVPSVEPLGVSIDYALHTFVLSFAALRRLRFTGGLGAPSEGDVAAQTALAALGLVAALAQDRAGYFLRSRCDLVPDSGASAAFEIVSSGGVTEALPLEYRQAFDLLKVGVDRAASLDVRWRGKDLVLEPQAKLIQLVKQSRERAMRGQVEPEGEV